MNYFNLTMTHINVLLIEDDPFERRLIVKALEPFAHVTGIAHPGAIDYVLSKDFELAIVDTHLGNGLFGPHYLPFIQNCLDIPVIGTCRDNNSAYHWEQEGALFLPKTPILLAAYGQNRQNKNQQNMAKCVQDIASAILTYHFRGSKT